MGSVTVEVGGGGGLVGGVEEGLLMGLGEEGQHVVHLHINPGTTVNFTTDDGQVQRISGTFPLGMHDAPHCLMTAGVIHGSFHDSLVDLPGNGQLSSRILRDPVHRRQHIQDTTVGLLGHTRHLLCIH